MKTAADIFSAQHASHDSLPTEKHGKSSRNQYLLVVVLLAVAYLFTIWVTSVPGGSATGIGSGFVFFWLGGGFITLILLTLAAKR